MRKQSSSSMGESEKFGILSPRENSDGKEAATLRRLLATPPDPKRNVKSDASPKKRGRPARGSKPDAP